MSRRPKMAPGTQPAVCGSCKARPAETCGLCRTCYMRQYRDAVAAAGVQAKAFQPGEPATPTLETRLLPWPEAEALLARMEQVAANATTRRVEQLGPRVVLERYQDMATGDSMQRLTIIEREA